MHRVRYRFRRLLARCVLLLFLLWTGQSQAQDIVQIAKSDPLIISGAVGTNNTFYHSTGYNYASPLQSTVWANLNVSVYGIAMPFAFYYSNSDYKFSYPQFQFKISPTYKQWHAFIGQGALDYSPYVLNSSVNGFGLEYTSDKLRFGAFYGNLRSAINDNPESLDARQPQYKRIGWGAKVGYGSKKHFVDLYFLRAYDCPSSIDEYWWSTVSPQSNLVVGLRGSTQPLKWMSINLNAATSAFTSDTRAPAVESGKVRDFDDIFNARYTSNMRFAGDASVNLNLGKTVTSLFYRFVQPNYTSLGTSYMTNNYHSFGLNLSTKVLKKINLSGTFSAQSDNLSDEQLYTTKAYVYSANATTRIGQQIVSLRYNGYLQDQSDGTAQVTDSSRVHRIMHSVGATTSRNWQTTNLSHTFSVSAGFNMNKDLNKFATGHSDVKTVSRGINYSLLVEPWQTDFSAALSHQQSFGYNRRYMSDNLALTASRSFFEENPLTVSATLSTCYNRLAKMRENMSLGGNMQVNYSLKKKHTFGLSASVSRSNDVNITSNEDMYNVTEVNVGFNYAYTFSLFEIKSKASKGKK